MLSFKLPQIWIDPRRRRLMRRAHKKEACPAQKGGLKSAGPCQNRIAGATPRMAQIVDFLLFLEAIGRASGFAEKPQKWL
jgi:hypothetical protein